MLVLNENFVDQMRNHIQLNKKQLGLSFLTNEVMWDFLKYEMQKFSISFSKSLAKEVKSKPAELNTTESLKMI